MCSCCMITFLTSPSFPPLLIFISSEQEQWRASARVSACSRSGTIISTLICPNPGSFKCARPVPILPSDHETRTLILLSTDDHSVICCAITGRSCCLIHILYPSVKPSTGPCKQPYPPVTLGNFS